MIKRTAHYVLSTHWDREWYQHFQDYRYRLVRLIDRVLQGWRNGSLAGPFQTDGQAIILEDYLEIRPERRAELEQRAREGKMVIGPWYVLPDEFLVSGESLVRNLQFGMAAARSFGGKPSRAGFLCDMFGHNSQMPQIMAGFGLRGAFLWRGCNLPHTRLFTWRAADGTAMLTYRFGWGGYCDYSRSVRASHQKNLPFDLDKTRADFQSFLANEATSTPAGTVLLFDGGDHMEWDPQAYQVVLEQMNQAQSAGQPFEVVHTSLDAYLEQLLAEGPRLELAVTGELREPARPPDAVDRQWLIPGVLSSRVWIKQRNAACQALLCQWAEPFSAMAHLALGSEVPSGFLNTAWKWLLQNHPHDSICGCSIDAVHEDMKFRFAQAEHIGERLKSEALRAITASAGGSVAEGELRVGVFNPLPVALDETVVLDFDIPAEWPVFSEEGSEEMKPAFRVYDSSGQELPYQRLRQAAGCKRVRMYDSGFPKKAFVNQVRAALRLRLPPMGYTTLTLRAGEEAVPIRHPAVPGIAVNERTLENETLRVEVQPNGSLAVTDKRSGQVYERWLTFEDCADIGDGWNYGPAVNDEAFSTTASRASVAVSANGPLAATLRVRAVLEVPVAFDFEHFVREPAFERLVIDTSLTLRAGSERLECECVVHNMHRDHRLRALFPSSASAALTYLADAPFDVIERPVALRADNHLYREAEVETKPQQTWTAVWDGRRGLAVIATGLLETAVQENPERTMALTLFRATGRTVFTNGEPEGQMQGDLHFRFWLAPLAAAPDRAGLSRLGQQLEAGLGLAQMAPADHFIYATGASLPAEGSLLSAEGGVVVTSVQMNGTVLEVRLFNPADEPVSAVLRSAAWGGKSWRFVQVVSLAGEPDGERLPLPDGELRLDVPPKRIITFQLVC